MEDEVRVVKKCPVCGWRLFDKLTATTGAIEMKCPRCHAFVRLDLEFRRQRNSDFASHLAAISA